MTLPEQSGSWVILLLAIGSGVVGGIAGSNKGRAAEGFLLGLLWLFFGLIVLHYLPPKKEVEADGKHSE